MPKKEITTTIEQFMTDEGYTIRRGIIDLGWVNGWGQKQHDICDALMQYEVKGTYYTSGPASWRKTSFNVNKDGEEYEVTYQTDSGD